jgi:hypothetical protein
LIFRRAFHDRRGTISRDCLHIGGEISQQPLRDGADLANTASYHVEVHSKKAGYLYVFLIDSRSKVFLLFPHQEGAKFSTGNNPVSPSIAITLPKRIPFNPYRSYGGIERLYAVFAAKRWPELETELRLASPRPTRTRGGIANMGPRNPGEEVLALLNRAQGVAVVKRCFNYLAPQK